MNETTISLLALGLLLLGAFVAWRQKAKWSMPEVAQIVEMLVQQIEQTADILPGHEKYSMVLGLAEKLGLTKLLSPELLEAMIESAVYRLKRAGQAPQPMVLPQMPEMPKPSVAPRSAPRTARRAKVEA